MSRLRPPSPITAIVYDDGARADRLLRDIAACLKAQGVKLAGFVQHAKPRTGRARCDMILEDLHSGARIEISEDRGPHARGCMLAVEQLVRASAAAARALDEGPDLLVINKFGKTEADGRGFRPLIAEALTRDIPMLIGVPRANLEKWRAFTDGFVSEYVMEQQAADPLVLCGAMGLLLPADALG